VASVSGSALMEIALKPNRRSSSFNYIRNKQMASARGPAGFFY
jgi:hypothetical protein